VGQYPSGAFVIRKTDKQMKDYWFPEEIMAGKFGGVFIFSSV
jgi:hypothetical protein